MARRGRRVERYSGRGFWDSGDGERWGALAGDGICLPKRGPLMAVSGTAVVRGGASAPDIGHICGGRVMRQQAFGRSVDKARQHLTLTRPFDTLSVRFFAKISISVGTYEYLFSEWNWFSRKSQMVRR